VINNENEVNKKFYRTKNTDPKIVVDINKLLNRVKIDERNTMKKKIIFYSLVSLSLSAIGIFIGAIK